MTSWNRGAPRDAYGYSTWFNNAAATLSSDNKYKAANQLHEDGAYWVYQYEALGQVAGGKKYWSDWPLVMGKQFEYGFDDLGFARAAPPATCRLVRFVILCSLFGVRSIFDGYFAIVLIPLLFLGPSFQSFAGWATNPLPASVQLSVEFRRGSIFVSAHINNSKPLSLKIDTGFGITTINPGLVETLHLKRIGKLTIVGIAGEEQAVTYEGASFNFGGITYSPSRIAVIPSESQRSRRGRDGILGADFFQRFVVEIDSAQNKLTLHDPKQFNYTGHGEILSLEFVKDTPIVAATINLTNHQSVTAKFEIDTGCDGELCLGQEFVQTNGLSLYQKSSRVRSRNGVGGSTGTRSAVLPQFQLGKLTLDRLPANFFTEGSPVDEGLAGHIGMKTLRRFKVIFDYSRKRMILEPSH